MLFLLTYSLTHDYTPPKVSVVVVCSSHSLMCFSPSSLLSWMVVQPLSPRESKVSCEGPSLACSVLYKLFVPCADALLQYQNRLRIPASAPWPAADTLPVWHRPQGKGQCTFGKQLSGASPHSFSVFSMFLKVSFLPADFSCADHCPDQGLRVPKAFFILSARLCKVLFFIG